MLMIFQLKKEIEDLSSRLGQQASQEVKEGSLSESSCKEEEPSSLQGPAQVKEEPGNNTTKEGFEEEPEVYMFSRHVLHCYKYDFFFALKK